MTTTFLRRTGAGIIARFLGVAAITALVLSACSTGGSNGAPGSLDKDLQDRRFASLSVNGHMIVAGTHVAISFTQDSVSASASCNLLGGSAATDGDTLVIGEVGMTEIGCDPARHAQDEWLLAFLTSTPAYALEGVTLTLTSGDVEIVFEEILPEAIDAGTWVLDGLISGNAVSSIPQGVTAEITFADTTAAYELGCNTGGATIEITPGADPGVGTVEFSEGMQTLMMCDSEAMAVERHLSDLYAGTVDFRIVGTSLTLQGTDIGATYQLVK